ncbi:MAG: hypothetical protein KJO73_11130 [Croceitalea sp.]|nr:hypothetical protein [Croceitalea sp.]
MEKFENHIRNTLEGRTIKPSQEAWSKIENQLPLIESKSNKTPFYWIAAAIIGVLLTSALFYLQSPKLPETNTTVVGVDVETPKENSIDNEQMRDNQLLPTKPTKVLPKKISVVQEEKTSILGVEKAVVATHIDRPKGDTVHQQESLIDIKVKTVVAEVMNLESQNVIVTEAEIDSLLLQAQQELLNEKIFQAKDQVDAMALLAEVEDELDRTFRGQLFEKLKDGFFKVRTAVADRNK